MKSSELRIGNYLYDEDGELCKVARIETPEYTSWNSGESFSIIALIVGSTDDYIYHIQDGNWRPIPLTEEWLLKFGFYLDFGVYWSESGRIKIKNTCGGNSYSLTLFEYDEFVDLYKPFQYVHQLQNLYFALTGEELKLKEIK